MEEHNILASSTGCEEARFWLALKFVPRLAIDKKLALVERFSIKQLFSDPPTRKVLNLSEKQYSAIVRPDWQKIDQIIQATIAAQSDILYYGHPLYPELLKQIFDPPLVLFVKGNKSVLTSNQIAVVGSRNASIYGVEHAQLFAKQLSCVGLTITSGLALGVDAKAHLAAVKLSRPTVAVIATGIDITYPSRHKTLASKILDAGGTIVSEFLPGVTPKPGHFPKRNRIISGLALGVVVIEATKQSGSLVTARCALEQNRDVFALPGSVINPQSAGCHWLIKQGAKLVECAADIVDELPFFEKNELNLLKSNTKEKRTKKSCQQGLSNDPLLASVGYEITPVDIVVSRSKLPTDVVLTRLMMLELGGLVTAVPGGYLKI
ncbi:DNA-processing protein DprA [Thalassotalea sp. 1_MG-2023]|uniref:DNA-processing protein DprA n=1 Tax=Thalassotalea sp. 1_MG-2023 TaxID=3062680 RepID=UPI0026E37133|nr:DNA-processing protein DprA [Thalassotalea sp. 1_MG-2023]MDO6427623.1 DNA-processing protein DprA [Thalassotalea sp. 1_MG-2023]